MAKKAKAVKAKKASSNNDSRRPWDDKDIKMLRNPKISVAELASKLKRSEGAIRQKAFALGISRRAA